MLTTFQEAVSHRMWFVPNIAVWGLPGLGEIGFVVVEQVGSDKTVLYGSVNPGGGEQTVLYADLVDHRGNNLPNEIESPKVIVRSHGSDAAFVVGSESVKSCRLARDPEAPSVVSADLMIIEMGD